MSDVIYVIPSACFFSSGRGGAVSHAIGVVSGFLELDKQVKLVAEPAVVKYFSGCAEIDLISVGGNMKCDSLISNVQFARRALLAIRGSTGEFVILRKNIYFIIACLLYSDVRQIVRDNCFVWEVNGLSYDKATNNPFLQLYALLVSSLNKIVMSRLGSKVYVVSKALESQLVSGCFPVNKNKVVVVPNGGPSWMGETVMCSPDKAQAVKFIFFGKYQAYNDYDLVLRTFKQLKLIQPLASLEFYGFGQCEGQIRDLAGETDGVSVNGPTTIQDLVFSGAIGPRTVGLIPLVDDPSVKVLSPIKLIEYISTGMPVLCSDTAELGEDAISLKNAYVSYRAGEKESLLRAMTSFFSDSYSWDEARQSCKVVAVSASWKTRMKMLHECTYENRCSS